MKIIFLCLFSLVQILNAQQYTTTVELDSNWSGWNAYIIKNGLISTATIPTIGARVMQYNLGEHKSIFQNSMLNGKSYTPAFDNNWYNFGGFKNWPAPQYGEGRWSWPPPPTIDYGKYDCEILVNTPDSIVLKSQSPIEIWRTPDLQFIRKMIIYKNSSHVRMEQFLVNNADTIQHWSIWDITQCIVNHTGMKDYTNFRTYFPINPNSVFGTDGVDYPSTFPGWVGEAAPGIFGTRFANGSSKLFGDPDKGWICYVDERDSVTYAKTFSIFNGAEYPDNGARVAIYMGNGYEEEEITGPIQAIPPNGGQISFTIDWWAAKVNGPILDINNAGAVHSSMKFQNGFITGNYGVFHVGNAKIVFLDNLNNIINEGIEHPVTPLENFKLSEAITIPENGVQVEIRIYDDEQNYVGTLENKLLNNLTAFNENNNILPKQFFLLPNFPNPFNPSTTISWEMPGSANVKLEVFDILGRVVSTLVNGYYEAGKHQILMDASGLPSGQYFIRLIAGQEMKVRKIVVMK